MAGRPRKENAEYTIFLHCSKGYRYAATQHYVKNEQTEKLSRKITYWGYVTEELEFTPNDRFILLGEAEKNKFIFPIDWNISKINVAQNKKQLEQEDLSEMEQETLIYPRGITEQSGKFSNLLYGAGRLLYGIANKIGILDDLRSVFEYDETTVQDVFTLAVAQLLNKQSLNDIEDWQTWEWAPSSHKLTSSFITKFTQKLDDNVRMNFCKLRIAREGTGALLGVDSTSRSAWGDVLADIRWGNNKDNKALKNTVELVVYSMTSHTPIYYRTFPGNQADVASLNTVISDLKNLGCENLRLIFDRGYQSNDNIQTLVKEGFPFLICAKTSQTPVFNLIESIQYDDTGMPQDISYHPTENLCCKQFEIDWSVTESNDANSKTVKLLVNVFINVVERSSKLRELGLQQQKDKALAQEIINEYSDATNIDQVILQTVNNQLVYCSLKLNKNQNKLEIIWNEKKLYKEKKTAGIFCSIAYKMEASALDFYDMYNKRDEQEKYFNEMKNTFDNKTQRNWSEPAKTGRLFILFVGLIIDCYLKHIWKTSLRNERFITAKKVLSELKTIRRQVYDNGNSTVTTLSDQQVKIFKAFDIEIPTNCLSSAQMKRLSQITSNPPKKGRRKGSINKPKI